MRMQRGSVERESPSYNFGRQQLDIGQWISASLLRTKVAARSRLASVYQPREKIVILHYSCQSLHDTGFSWQNPSHAQNTPAASVQKEYTVIT